MFALAEHLIQFLPAFSVIVLGATLVGGAWMVCQVADQARKHAGHHAKMELKQDLVARGLRTLAARGFDVDEIERIVEAGRKAVADDRSVKPPVGKNPSGPTRRS